MQGRFAPTPSGRMHIGNIYAMLAAWLSARSDAHGRIALRIEDIDTPRVVADADRWIMDDLFWLGLEWDGEPVYQSQRIDCYQSAFSALRGLPLAGVDGDVPPVYPCFCSRADIRAASAPQEGDGFVLYPGTCRRAYADNPQRVQTRLSNGDRHAWRVAVPQLGSPENRVQFDDRVFGLQSFDLSHEVGDSVVQRSDGLFSYQLAVVVDDLLMGVDDIVRGRDLLRSTALQIWIRRRLLEAGFGAGRRSTPCDAANPAYAHLPLIDDRTRRRLAKREHAFDLGRLRAEGVDPRQIIGYCSWVLGLREPGQSGPRAISAQEALELFSWSWPAADTRDHILTDPLSLRNIT